MKTNKQETRRRETDPHFFKAKNEGREKAHRKKQWLLQVAIALVLLCIVIFIEVVGKNPPGIYLYTVKGYKNFQIGLSKPDILTQINEIKTIREIKTCRPDMRMTKKRRKKIPLDKFLQNSNTWIGCDRTGKRFLFIFEENRLERLLIQRLGLGEKNGLPIFDGCLPEALDHLESYLAGQKNVKVYQADLQHK